MAWNNGRTFQLVVFETKAVINADIFPHCTLTYNDSLVPI